MELMRQIFASYSGFFILEMMGQRAKKTPPPKDDGDPGHTGLFTSGVVATRAGVRIALFFSDLRHAGENLSHVLQHRAAQLEAPMQMCDGLARNLPKELDTILANCLAHGRRNFVELHDRLPEECRHVIEAFKVIYHNDKIARDAKMSAEARLALHQKQSKPTVDNLHACLRRQLDDKLIKPNSALGDATNYLLKRWEPLTLFLREAGASDWRRVPLHQTNEGRRDAGSPPGSLRTAGGRRKIRRRHARHALSLLAAVGGCVMTDS